MNNQDARKELCKMVNDMAGRLGIPEAGWACTCGTGLSGTNNDVDDKVIAEMWRRLTHPCWSAENHPVSMGVSDA